MDRDARTGAQWIATDGGPLLLVPEDRLGAWRGSFIEGEDGDFTIETEAGTFAFRTDYDFTSARTDYERACAAEQGSIVAPCDVDGATALVIGDLPLETTWVPLPDGGLLAGKLTVELGADLDTERTRLSEIVDGAEHSPTGLSIDGGRYLLIDALDHGLDLQRAPVVVALDEGAHRVLIVQVMTGLVTWNCVRLVRLREGERDAGAGARA